MTGRGSVGQAARLLCAAATISLLGSRTGAQQAPPASAPAQTQAQPGELDPSAPLSPMPDLGVDWPDLNTKDEIAPVATGPDAKPVAVQPSDDASGNLRYASTIEGIAALANAEDILKAFRQQSTLEAER